MGGSFDIQPDAIDDLVNEDRAFVKRVILEVAEKWQYSNDWGIFCIFCKAQERLSDDECNHAPGCIVPRCIELAERLKKEDGRA